MPATTIPATPDTILGLDMDLTITADGPFFSRLTKEIKQVGGRVVVIAARPSRLLAALWQELDESNISCDFAFCLPGIEEAFAACPHRETLGWYKGYLWHKARIAFEQGVTHYVDDEPPVHDVFRQYLPNVQRFYPWQLCESIGHSTAVHDDALYQSYVQRMAAIDEVATRISRKVVEGSGSSRGAWIYGAKGTSDSGAFTYPWEPIGPLPPPLTREALDKLVTEYYDRLRGNMTLEDFQQLVASFPVPV